ncbi:MAG: hypothetical protein EOO82_01085 [Oxalobacteraceae bacterium]|nr:MAG: hypothetical protein EOO82_01085 [Oxalobacteraceae bacterium]
MKTSGQMLAAIAAFSVPFSASAQRTMNPVQFVSVSMGADGKGYGFFIERPTERQGIANLYNFYVVPVKGARMPQHADAMRLQLIFPCDKEIYQRFGMELLKGGTIIGGEGPAMMPDPLPKAGQMAFLRTVACGSGPKPSGPLLSTFEQITAATEQAR